MILFVKPAPGRRIRRPDQGYRLLPEEGMPVEWSPYWERLLSDGDVVIVESDAPAPQVKAPKSSGGDS